MGQQLQAAAAETARLRQDQAAAQQALHQQYQAQYAQVSTGPPSRFASASVPAPPAPFISRAKSSACCFEAANHTAAPAPSALRCHLLQAMQQASTQAAGAAMSTAGAAMVTSGFNGPLRGPPPTINIARRGVTVTSAVPTSWATQQQQQQQLQQHQQGQSPAAGSKPAPAEQYVPGVLPCMWRNPSKQVCVDGSS